MDRKGSSGKGCGDEDQTILDIAPPFLLASHFTTSPTMSTFLAEIIGTMLLIVLGDGVVANVVLKQTKGHASGWLVIATGWGLAVTIAVYSVNTISGAHLNPAVTIGMLVLGKIGPGLALGYIIAQMIGAFLGAVLVWLAYLPHWGATEDKAAKLGVFCTSPAIRRPSANLITEIIGTFVLVLGVLAVLRPENLTAGSGFSNGFGPALVGVIVWAIGLSLGGPTGYAINPARDLGPRIAHAVLPIPGKGGSDWDYAWVPIAGPIIGGIIAAVFFKMCW
jgi:glycerol uptake facilitator protein